MIAALLVTTFVIAFVVASIVVLIFSKPIDSILKQVVPPELSYAWARYLRFAIYVVGIGGGVQVWSFDKYLNQQETAKGLGPIELDSRSLDVGDIQHGDRDSAEYGDDPFSLLRLRADCRGDCAGV